MADKNSLPGLTHACHARTRSLQRPPLPTKSDKLDSTVNMKRGLVALSSADAVGGNSEVQVMRAGQLKDRAGCGVHLRGSAYRARRRIGGHWIAGGWLEVLVVGCSAWPSSGTGA